jgi:hypothetical protein
VCERKSNQTRRLTLALPHRRRRGAVDRGRPFQWIGSGRGAGESQHLDYSPSQARRSSSSSRPPYRSRNVRLVIPVERLPVGAMPIRAPLWVPVPVQRVGDLVSIRDLIREGEADIRERGQVNLNKLSVALPSTLPPGTEGSCRTRLVAASWSITCAVRKTHNAASPPITWSPSRPRRSWRQRQPVAGRSNRSRSSARSTSVRTARSTPLQYSQRRSTERLRRCS